MSPARLAAVVLALIGVALVVAGGLRATVLAPDPVSQATLVSPGQPVITTSVGLLGLDGPRVQVDANDGSRRQVFLGIGRAADVDAYLAEVARLEVTGHDGEGNLLTRRLGTEPSLPDPATADIWVVSERGAGTADLAWPDAAGQWRLVVATDGTARAPTNLALTWSGRELHSLAPVLIAVGLLLSVLGLVILLVLISRSRLDGEL